MQEIILVGILGSFTMSHATQPSFRFLDSTVKDHAGKTKERIVLITRTSILTPSPSHVFQLAYKDYLKGRYQLAIESFEQYIKDYPASSLAPRAYFYLGEAYYINQDWASAEKAFSTLASKFSSSRLIPLALFKLGNVQVQMGKPGDAFSYWSRIIKEFPNSPEAKLARRNMAKIRHSRKHSQEQGKQNILNHDN